MSSEVYENIKRTTQATIDAYMKWDLDAIMKPRSDDCVYQFRPLSLKQPAMDNATYREYYGTQIIPLFKDFNVTVENVVIDPVERQSIVHGFSSAQSPVGPYGPIEMMLMMNFNETGDKVIKMDEMFDSAVLMEFLGRVEAFKQSQQEVK